MRAEAKIDLSALVHNYRLCLARAKEGQRRAKLWCVVKSNAYGHGLIPCTKALYRAGARYFAVAKIEEGMAVRHMFPDAEVLVLGKTSPKQANVLHYHRLIQSVDSLSYGKALSEATEGEILVHAKLDCGMGRMGFSTDEIYPLTCEILALSALSHIRLQGVFAHLPEADDPSSAETPLQIQKFQNIVGILHGQGLPIVSHLSATAALLRFGTAGCDMARVGIGLYGLSPSPFVVSPSLKPVLTLTCPLLQVKRVKQGTKAGYGGTWTAPCDTQIGIIPFGYKDGLPRLCQGGKVFVYGHPALIAGRISMDYATLWLGDIPAEEGDSVTVYDKKGKNILALAKQAQTIPYELLTNLDERVCRKYV